MKTEKANAPSGEDLVFDEQNIPYKMDSGLGERARIGLIVLSGDQTIEYEIRNCWTFQAYHSMGIVFTALRPLPRKP